VVVKIEGPNQTRPLTGPKKATRSGDASFAGHLTTGEGAAVDAPAASSPLFGVSSLALLQEVDNETEGRKRRARMRAEELLDRLDVLRLQLLSGEISRDNLLVLARLIQSRREDGLDPQLSALLDDVELRVQVELAKLGIGAS
jgi:hypothetical protein